MNEIRNEARPPPPFLRRFGEPARQGWTGGLIPTAATFALGVAASFQLWLTLRHVEAFREQGAAVALVAGLVISGLLALLMRIGQTARSRGVSLIRSDADLRESMDETEREGTEIRELRGALETRVTQRTATLQETIEELETFNYSVSHDLRSPIGAVINFAAILQHDHGDQLDPSAKDCLDRISVSAKVAVSLMDGLLAFSRSGREEIHKIKVDMRDLVEGVRDDLSAADPRAGTSIQIGELPDAHADPAMMRRVFTNLISNALKFARTPTLGRLGTHTLLQLPCLDEVAGGDEIGSLQPFGEPPVNAGQKVDRALFFASSYNSVPRLAAARSSSERRSLRPRRPGARARSTPLRRRRSAPRAFGASPPSAGEAPPGSSCPGGTSRRERARARSARALARFVRRLK